MSHTPQMLLYLTPIRPYIKREDFVGRENRLLFIPL